MDAKIKIEEEYIFLRIYNGKKWIELKNYNLVINCLPGFMGYSMLETIIELDLPCIDLSFMPENCLDLYNGKLSKQYLQC